MANVNNVNDFVEQLSNYIGEISGDEVVFKKIPYTSEYVLRMRNHNEKVADIWYDYDKDKIIVQLVPAFRSMEYSLDDLTIDTIKGIGQMVRKNALNRIGESMEINEAKTILKNAGYICEKQDEMYNNKKYNAIKELSKEIGISINEISESSENYDHYAPDYVLEANLNGEKAVFVVYDNHQSAYEAAVDDLTSQFLDDPAILGAAIDYFGINKFKDFIDAGESDLDEIESIYGDMGKEEFAKFVQKHVATNFNVNYKGFAKYNIKQLGIAWNLADYDGKEIKLDNGMLVYRVE